MKSKYSLGDEVKEVVTGFTGVVMGITFYYTGCVHYGVLSRKLDKDGTERQYQWYDESRLSFKGQRITFPGLAVIPARSGPFPTPPNM